MTNCTEKHIEFPVCRRRKVEAEFSGGDVTSDGGVLLIREIDRRLNLTRQVAAVLPDPRDPKKCDHTILDLVRQRVFGLVLGYEDLNDHDRLRRDPAFQTAVERDEWLASSPTLCRFEQRADRATAWALHRILIEQFIASQKTPPKELMLDFDATNDPLHGSRSRRFSTAIMTSIAFCRCMCFAGINSW